jgi:hypothetical protein
MLDARGAGCSKVSNSMMTHDCGLDGGGPRSLYVEANTL